MTLQWLALSDTTSLSVPPQPASHEGRGAPVWFTAVPQAHRGPSPQMGPKTQQFSPGVTALDTVAFEKSEAISKTIW